MYNNLTCKEAHARTIACIEKGKKGTVSVLRSDDGTLLFCAARLRQPIQCLQLCINGHTWTEDTFNELLVMRSSFEKQEHWMTFYELPAPDQNELKLKASSMVTPCDFKCDIIMKAPKGLHYEQDDEKSSWLTYRIRLHGAEGAAMLVQDDGAAQLTMLDISLERRMAQFASCHPKEHQTMKEDNGYEDNARNYDYDREFFGS